MSAEVELLREAARVMRERASAATPGPWAPALGQHGDVMVEQPRDYGHLVADVPTCPDHEGFRVADATHIASWHPAVALAVADWLDNAHAYFAPIWTGPHVPPELAQALAVARAYLGGAR